MSTNSVGPPPEERFNDKLGLQCFNRGGGDIECTNDFASCLICVFPESKSLDVVCVPFSAMQQFVGKIKGVPPKELDVQDLKCDRPASFGLIRWAPLFLPQGRPLTHLESRQLVLLDG